jgi:cell division protein FtsA
MNARGSAEDLPDLLMGRRLAVSEEPGRHLNDEEFVGYLMVGEHLAECPQCNEEMNRLAEAEEAWRTPEMERRRVELLRQLKQRVASAEVGARPQPDEPPRLSPTDASPARPVRKLGRSARGLLVAIDIGSSKVAVLIGERTPQGNLDVVGRGLVPNRGTRKGHIVNVEATVEALKQASEEAEAMAGVEIARAYVGLAGADIRSVNSRGMVTVARKDRQITRQDIQRVLEAAQSAALPADREILHAVPQEFIVDGQGGIDDPLGMLGTRLEVTVHLVTGSIVRSRTLLACVNRAGIEVVEMVFEPLAAAAAVLSPDERELGALLIDVGAGTTEAALFYDGEVQYSTVLPIGAGHFTNDLAMVLRTPFAEAERLKIAQGCCLPSMAIESDAISVSTVAGGASRVVPRRELCEILQPRAEELFEMLRADLGKHVGDDAPRAAVVLTGGGAQLDGLFELAEQVFDASVRYGLPRGLGGRTDLIGSPTWSTAAGLLLHAHGVEPIQDQVQKRSGFSVRGMVGGLRGVFAGLLRP